MFKSFGQIAFEAMIQRMRDRGEMSPPTGDPYLDCVWSAQPQVLRDDWEAIAGAVCAVKDGLN